MVTLSAPILWSAVATGAFCTLAPCLGNAGTRGETIPRVVAKTHVATKIRLAARARVIARVHLAARTWVLSTARVTSRLGVNLLPVSAKSRVDAKTRGDAGELLEDGERPCSGA